MGNWQRRTSMTWFNLSFCPLLRNCSVLSAKGRSKEDRELCQWGKVWCQAVAVNSERFCSCIDSVLYFDSLRGKLASCGWNTSNEMDVVKSTTIGRRFQSTTPAVKLHGFVQASRMTLTNGAALSGSTSWCASTITRKRLLQSKHYIKSTKEISYVGYIMCIHVIIEITGVGLGMVRPTGLFMTLFFRFPAGLSFVCVTTTKKFLSTWPHSTIRGAGFFMVFFWKWTHFLNILQNVPVRDIKIMTFAILSKPHLSKFGYPCVWYNLARLLTR